MVKPKSCKFEKSVRARHGDLMLDNLFYPLLIAGCYLSFMYEDKINDYIGGVLLGVCIGMIMVWATKI